MSSAIDSRLLEALQASTCFGIAHDESVPECKMCDVKAQCKKKSEGADIPVPTTKVVAASSKPKEVKKEVPAKETKKPASKSTPAKAATKNTSKSEAPKPASTPSGNIPDFKSLQLEELKDMAKERNVEWKDYGNDSITRMRLIMALKKSY